MLNDRLFHVLLPMTYSDPGFNTTNSEISRQNVHFVNPRLLSVRNYFMLYCSLQVLLCNPLSIQSYGFEVHKEQNVYTLHQGSGNQVDPRRILD